MPSLNKLILLCQTIYRNPREFFNRVREGEELTPPGLVLIVICLLGQVWYIKLAELTERAISDVTKIDKPVLKVTIITLLWFTIVLRTNFYCYEAQRAPQTVTTTWREIRTESPKRIFYLIALAFLAMTIFDGIVSYILSHETLSRKLAKTNASPNTSNLTANTGPIEPGSHNIQNFVFSFCASLSIIMINTKYFLMPLLERLAIMLAGRRARRVITGEASHPSERGDGNIAVSNPSTPTG